MTEQIRMIGARIRELRDISGITTGDLAQKLGPVSYTHLRAHETPEHLVCRLLLEKKKKQDTH